MEHVTRTVYLSALQSAMVRGAPYKWHQYTTLNEKFNVLSGEYPAAGVYPLMSYIVLGRGALSMVLGADGEPFPEIFQHKSTDASLFDFMPFSLRLKTDDLPATRRNRYALRVSLEVNGIQYWAYYAKRVDFASADTDLLMKHVNEAGDVVVTDFVPDQSNLNPQRVDLADSGTNLLAGYSVAASTIIDILLDEFDINEIRNASLIIKGATGKAIVSELAICTGASKQIQAPSQSGTFPFLEAVGVQTAAFVQTIIALDYNNAEYTDQLELGISEPLFRLEGVNA